MGTTLTPAFGLQVFLAEEQLPLKAGAPPWKKEEMEEAGVPPGSGLGDTSEEASLTLIMGAINRGSALLSPLLVPVFPKAELQHVMLTHQSLCCHFEKRLHHTPCTEPRQSQGATSGVGMGLAARAAPPPGSATAELLASPLVRGAQQPLRMCPGYPTN